MAHGSAVSATARNPAAPIFLPAAREAAASLRGASVTVHQLYGSQAERAALSKAIRALGLAGDIPVCFFAGSFSANGMQDDRRKLYFDKAFCSHLANTILILYSDTDTGNFPEKASHPPDPVRAVLAYVPCIALSPGKTFLWLKKRYPGEVIKNMQGVLTCPLLVLLGGRLRSMRIAFHETIRCWNGIGQDPRTDSRLKMCCDMNLKRLKIFRDLSAQLPAAVRRRVP